MQERASRLRAMRSPCQSHMEEPHDRGEAMKLTQIAGSDCKHGQCPAVFATDRGTVAIQGDVVDRRTPEGEAVVEISVNLLREAIRALDR